MYPTDVPSSTNVQPQSFVTIEQCMKELSGLQAKLSPISSPLSDKLQGSETPSVTELDSRLGALLTYIRDISRGVKL